MRLTQTKRCTQSCDSHHANYLHIQRIDGFRNVTEGTGFSYGSHRSRRARTARTHRHAANPADGESNDPCQDASAHEAAEPRSNRMAWSDTPNSANYAITDSRGHATRTPAQYANRHAGISFLGTARSSSPSSYRAHTPRPRCTCRTPNGQARTPPKNRGWRSDQDRILDPT